MNTNFRKLFDRVRSALGMKQYRQPLDQLRRFRPIVETLEDRLTPSTSTPQALAVYQALSLTADHIAIELEGAAQSALANSQTIQQAIGSGFLQGVFDQMQTDLAPLVNINFGATPAGGLFGAATDAQFAQKCKDFLRTCVCQKIFARCTTQAASDNASIDNNICTPFQLANLSGAVTYGTTCVRICDEIFVCQLDPCVQEFCIDIYDDDPCVLQNEPLDIQNGIDQGDALVPPVLQNGEQQIEGYIADPSSVTVTQTPTLEFDRADASLASSTTFTLSTAGIVESSNTSIFDPTGTAIQEQVQNNYAANGLVASQDVTLLNADASTNSSYDTTNLNDGSSITVQTVFDAGGLVANQDLTVYNPDGSVVVSVNTTDVEAADNSLATTQGIVTVADGTLSNTYTITNTETAGALSGSVSSASGSAGFQLVGATAAYDPNNHMTSMTSTGYDQGAATGSTTVDGNGDPVTSGGGGSGSTGGGGNTGGGGGGFTGGGGNTGGGGGGGGGNTGGGGYTGGGGGGNTGGGGYTGGGGGDTGGDGGFTGGGDSGGGGDFEFAAVRSTGVFVPAGAMALPSNAPVSNAVAANPPFVGIVGSFFDSDPNAADYSAIITWGDGTASAGIVSSVGAGEFDVFGTHPSAPDVTDRIFVSVTNVKNGDQLFAAQPAALPFTDNFANVGLSSSWATESGQYIALGNEATALDFNTPNVAVLKGVSAADVAQSVGVSSLLSGQSAALVARYHSSGADSSYYYGGITRTGNSYSADIYKSIDGTSTLLTTRPVASSLFNGTGTFRFEVEGSSLRVIVDQGNSHVLVAFTSDTSITAPGTVGLWGSTDATFTNYSTNAVIPTNASLAPSFTDAFAPTPDGQLSTYWHGQVGDLSLANDTATGQTAYNLTTLNGVNQANVAVQAVINVPAGQYAGLVTRYQGTNDQNMYFGMIASSGSGYVAQIYVNHNGVWTLLAPATSVGTVGQGTLLFTTIGSSLQLFWQPAGTTGFKQVASASDSSLTTGSVGIRAGLGAMLANFVATAVTAQNAALPFSENFGAANYSGNPGAQLSSFWQNQVGDLSIVSGKATGQTAYNLATLNGVNQANVSVQAVINVPVGQYAGLVTRYQGTGDQNMYFGMIASTGSGYVARIFVNHNGIWTLLAPAASVGAVGQGTLAFTNIGSSLQLFWNGVMVLSTTDSSLTGGSVGLRVGQGAAAANFSATAVTLQNAALPFTENFGAANYPSNPGAQLSSYWQNQAGDLSLVNGKATGQTAYNVATLNGINQANVAVQAAINVPIGQYAGLVTRYQGTADQNMYFGMIASSGSGYVARIFVNHSGVWTLLAPATSVGTVGQGTLLFTAIGSSLQLFWQPSGTNGFKLVTSATDASLTTGSVGIRVGSGAALAYFTATAVTPQNATLPFNENFSAANYPSNPGAQLSSFWQNQVGDLSLVNGKATGQTTYNLATLNGVNQSDVLIQAVINVPVGQYAGLVTRYQGTGDQNMYFGMIASTGSGYVAKIYVNHNGVWTLLAPAKSVGTVGQGTLQFTTIGSSLQLFWNGVMIISTTDSSLKTGSVGARLGQGAALINFTATGS
jgi:hypothetical protein